MADNGYESKLSDSRGSDFQLSVVLTKETMGT